LKVSKLFHNSICTVDSNYKWLSHKSLQTIIYKRFYLRADAIKNRLLLQIIISLIINAILNRLCQQKNHAKIRWLKRMLWIVPVKTRCLIFAIHGEQSPKLSMGDRTWTSAIFLVEIGVISLWLFKFQWIIAAVFNSIRAPSV
jgi:hypothetical protein